MSQRLPCRTVDEHSFWAEGSPSVLGWEVLGAVQRRGQQLEGIALGAGTRTYKALWDIEGNFDFLFYW